MYFKMLRFNNYDLCPVSIFTFIKRCHRQSMLPSDQFSNKQNFIHLTLNDLLAVVCLGKIWAFLHQNYNYENLCETQQTHNLMYCNYAEKKISSLFNLLQKNISLKDKTLIYLCLLDGIKY